MLFENTSDFRQKVSYSLLQNGCVSLFYKKAVLEKYIKSLQHEDFDIIVFDCTTWKEKKDFYNEISRKLSFPGYFGGNLDALNDCLSDIEIPKKGLALVFERFDSFAIKFPAMAEVILDIVHQNSWHQLLFGKGMIAMVQSDDPQIEFNNIGTMPAFWNPDEWLDKNRGI